jgi:hypothetical protein
MKTHVNHQIPSRVLKICAWGPCTLASNILLEFKQNIWSKHRACGCRITFGRSQTDGHDVSPSWEAYCCLVNKLPTFYGTCSYACLPEHPDAGAFPETYKSSSPLVPNHPIATQLLSLISVALILSHVLLCLQRHCFASCFWPNYLYVSFTSNVLPNSLGFYDLSIWRGVRITCILNFSDQCHSQ